MSCRCSGPRSSEISSRRSTGLEILPLDGTFTPLDGDYLWRVNDHGRTVRELRRWSATDAEAYDEYSRPMVEMARFIKPILSIAPPDPGRLRPQEWFRVARLARAFNELSEEQRAAFVQLMTMSAADFLDQWFENDPLKATMSASGIIGVPGDPLPGTAYVLLHHYMGEIDGVLRAWGIPRGGTGVVSGAIAGAARSFGAEIRTEAAVEALPDSWRRGDRRGDELGRGSDRPGDARASTRSRRSSGSFRRASSMRRSWTKWGATGTAARAGRSTWPWTGFPISPACPARASTRGAISFSPSIDYMERPTTTQRPGASAGVPTST